MMRFAFDLGEWFSANETQVRVDLNRYYSPGSGYRFTGRWFETFAAMGDPYRFEPSDVLAVEALSVKVPPESAAKLIVTDTERFNSLLRRVPKDIDLWDVDESVIGVGSPGSELHTELDSLADIGWVTAGKLLAAKRPRLVPILDKEVRGLLKPPPDLFWATMHDHLRDAERRKTIAEVCTTAPDGVSLLRRIDVALWMHATQQNVH